MEKENMVRMPERQQMQTMKKRVHEAGRKIMGMKAEDCVR